MHIIEHTFVSLLADVASQSGFSEIRGSYLGLHWSLHEAPKLEKQVLQWIEDGIPAVLDLVPPPLHRLVVASLVDANMLRLLRQLLLFSYKASVTHDQNTTTEALNAFDRVNRAAQEFGNNLARVSPVLLDSARRHCQSVLSRVREYRIIPSHGPGAVTTSKEKWMHRYSSIEYLYPYSDWYCLYANRDHAESWSDAADVEHITARLVAVPKDSRGPRLICVHPSEAIWIQQGLRRELERAISLQRYSMGPWPKNHIHFDDQSVNGKIALLSSKSRRYATLDMKEASDRISESLVQVLFGRKYKWFGCCRAQKYVVDKQLNFQPLDDNIYSYAPMGNATTFPVQSVVFWAICVASLQRQGFRQPGAVFVFGDDLEVPTACVEGVINDLESFGLVVNRNKSFWRSHFRESCGVDAFKGVNVTPVRWKTDFNAEHLTGLQALSDIAMRLRIAGYDRASSTAYAHLRYTLWSQHGKEVFFTNNSDHGGIAEYTPFACDAFRDAFWHTGLHWFANRVWRLKFKDHKINDCDWNHILESVLSLERAGSGEIPVRFVSRRTRLDRGWTMVQ